MPPRVSVVMPAHDHARFVGQAIQSILDQSFQDFEIVVTDDGSTDDTPAVVRRFSDPRLTLEVFPKNRGAVVAQNASIQRSRGEFVAVLNSDDYFLPGKLAMQVAFLDAHPQVSAVFGMPRRVDEQGKPLDGVGEFRLPLGNAQSRFDWLRVFFFTGNCLCHPTVLIRRSALDEAGLYDPRLASLPDLDMWVRLAMRHELRVMPEELTAFRVHGRNASGGQVANLRRFQFEFLHILKHYRRLPVADLRSIFSAELTRFGINQGQIAMLLLADLAAAASQPAHQLFALDTLFEAYEQSGLTDYRRLHDLSGRLNPFGLGNPTK